MSQPPPYARVYDFTDFQSTNPSDPPPGAQLDAEYNAVLATLVGVLANLVLLQRDDGALANGIVTLDSLSAATLTALAANFNIRGAWLTTTSYAVNDLVTHGTGTYVCATAHTSGTFATDLAAGKWVTLFDSSGASIADGSVTTAKIADGAVTLAKLTLTALDLTGSIRGQAGISSGTAAVGEQMANKQAAGNVVTKVSRTSAAQGTVGYRIEGFNVTWDTQLAISGTDLTWSNGAASGAMSLSTAGLFNVTGAVRAAGDVTPSSGVGPILRYVSGSGVGYLDCYNYATAAWKDLYLRGLSVVIIANGITIGTVDSNGITIASGKSLKKGSLEVGLSGLPTSSQSMGSTIQLAAADVDHKVPNTAGGWNIPASVFSDGDSLVLINRSGSAQNLTITGGAGTLHKAGTATTGTLSVLQWGIVLLCKDGSDFIANGSIG